MSTQKFSRKWPAAFCVLALMSVLQSCAYLASSKQVEEAPPAVPLEQFNPAGLWIYEVRFVTGEANLDENGNGGYPWKEGYFVTQGWEGRLWKGTWHQPGNDREGGFEAQLSRDLRYAEGRWWYTRIGSDTSPSRRGAKFTLTRISP